MEETKNTEQTTYTQMTSEELEEALSAAISEEAYEKASIIRDEISKRKKKI